MTRFRVFVAVLGILACGTIAKKPTVPEQCGRLVYGACVIFEDGAMDLSQERLERGFRASAAMWGTLPAALDGFTIIVRGIDAWALPNGDGVWGVTYQMFPRMEYSTPMPLCPELVLAHEWGHAGARIMNHDDPRFRDEVILPYLRAAGLSGC